MTHSRPASAAVAQREDPQDNHLLATITGADWERFRNLLVGVDLRAGQSLYEPGRPPHHAYFPTTAVVSLLCTDANGASTEIAVVGNEGVVGVSLLLGGNSTTSGGSVLIAGQGFRIRAQAIQDEFDRTDAVRNVLLLYVQALSTQIAQAAMCNRHHTVEQQVCGFLLHSLDRLRGGEILMTHELLAAMLGVRRESVTMAAGHLQEVGVIHYARGHVTVLDPAGLERRSCECHAVVKKEYQRLLPQKPLAPRANPGRRTWSAGKAAAPAQSTPQQEREAVTEP